MIAKFPCLCCRVFNLNWTRSARKKSNLFHCAALPPLLALYFSVILRRPLRLKKIPTQIYIVLFPCRLLLMRTDNPAMLYIIDVYAILVKWHVVRYMNSMLSYSNTRQNTNIQIYYLMNRSRITWLHGWLIFRNVK